jgi:oxygen-independent coproporphyrinogen-3 oxidase
VAALERRYAIDFEHYFADSLAQLAPLEADGLVTLTRGRVAATTQGRLLLRNIAMCFDRYLDPGGAGQHPAAPRYSRAI